MNKIKRPKLPLYSEQAALGLRWTVKTTNTDTAHYNLDALLNKALVFVSYLGLHTADGFDFDRRSIRCWKNTLDRIGYLE